MYQALLTRRYLLSKIMPLLASLGVMLCTAMVLVVWSVMGGFLVTLLGSGKVFMGDVGIAWPQVGMAHYRELIAELEKEPGVAAATPTIEALGLLSLPGGEPRTVQVLGIEPEGYQRVAGYFDSLWWRRIEKPLPKDVKGEDPRLHLAPGFDEAGRRLVEHDPRTGMDRPAIVLGTEVSRYNERRPEGFYDVWPGGFMPNQEVTLSLLPLTQRGTVVSTQDRRFPVANEFKTGFFEVDSNWVIAPLAIIQSMLKMDAAQKVDPASRGGSIVRGPDGVERIEPPKIIGIEPARVTGILVKASQGVSPSELERRVRAVYTRFSTRPEHAEGMPRADRVMIFTWETRPGISYFINAVKHETVLVLVLFSFISVTAVFLVLAIFWAMVAEKTKDVGVLRAIGAGRAGVAWLWVRYGMLIGLVGSTLGIALSYAIVWNINPIHEWMGRALGIVIWDPRVYYFTEIPARVSHLDAAVVYACGVLSCMIGALIPAVRAATMDPVRALRFE